MTFDEWYKSAKIFPPGTMAQMKMAYEAGRSDGSNDEALVLLRELWAWKESPETEAWFQNAYIHGCRVSKNYSDKVGGMNNRIREFFKRTDAAPQREEGK